MVNPYSPPTDVGHAAPRSLSISQWLRRGLSVLNWLAAAFGLLVLVFVAIEGELATLPMAAAAIAYLYVCFSVACWSVAGRFFWKGARQGVASVLMFLPPGLWGFVMVFLD